MKKTLLIITILCSSYFSANAQPYVPMLDSINHWKFVQDYIPVQPEWQTCNNYLWAPYTMSADTDTIINAIRYKIMYQDNYNKVGFIREDTGSREIYYIDPAFSPEQLIYNFSMQIGDSIYLTHCFQGPGQWWSDGYYQLDSVTWQSTGYTLNRKFNLSCHSCSNSHTLSWIEGVGNEANPLYTYSDNGFMGGMFSTFGCLDFPHDKGGPFVSCFEHAQRVYYDVCALTAASPGGWWIFTDSCTYNWCCGSVNDFDFSSTVSVKTNPFHERTELIIEKNNSSSYRLRLVDQTGRVVRDEDVKSGNILIDRRGLSNGMYSFVLIDKKGHYANGKLIIQ